MWRPVARESNGPNTPESGMNGTRPQERCKSVGSIPTGGSNRFAVMNESKFVDIITERPVSFHIGKKRFYLYPLTLGKSLVLSGLVQGLGLNAGALRNIPTVELFRVCERRRVEVCRIIAVHTCRTKEEVFDADLLNTRINAFIKGLKRDELVSLFIACLTHGEQNIEDIKKHFGIAEEQKWFERAVNAREDNNTYTFFGKSIYGTLIGHACEKYGWTFDYVLWGISQANLTLLVADEVRTVYLSDKERKSAHIPQDRNVMKAENMSVEQIKKALNLC